MIFGNELSSEDVDDVSLRTLAHLGDAVFDLYEREKEVARSKSAKSMHLSVVSRVNAISQATLLLALEDKLTEREADLVRRARNMKTTNYKKVDQSVYRRATAFEALLGYLYVSDFERLREVLGFTDQVEISDV